MSHLVVGGDEPIHSILKQHSLTCRKGKEYYDNTNSRRSGIYEKSI